MSLINEALKKAQRLRTEDQADDAAPVPGGSMRVAKRKQARSANTLVLIASGALVLVVVSVVVTVWLLNRPSVPPAPVAAAPANQKAVATGDGAATPSIIPPAITASIGAAEIPTTLPGADTSPSSSPVADATISGETKPTVSSTETPGRDAQSQTAPANIPSPAATAAEATPMEGPGAGTPSSPAAASTATSVAQAVPPGPSRPDERVAAFVDSIRVAGIRSSGDDSRVLMNERVYRVNDIVERTLGVRLVNVTTDSLTFADGNGTTYVKHF